MGSLPVPGCWLSTLVPEPLAGCCIGGEVFVERAIEGVNEEGTLTLMLPSDY